MSITPEQVAAFRRDGFLLVKRFLSREKINEIRTICVEYFRTHKTRAVNQGFIEPDVPRAIPELAWLLTHPPAIEIARQLCGKTVLHTHDSVVHYRHVNRGWHKDARDYARQNMSGTDWNDDYSLVHFVYYLQDHVDHSGGISFKRGSHRIRNHIDGETVTVDSEAGDLVIFDLRTTHSGNSLKLKPPFRFIPTRFIEPIPWRRFYVRAFQPLRLIQPVLWKVPQLYLPDQPERLALFFVYGGDDQHTRNFFDYLKARADYPQLAPYSEPERLT